MSNINRWWNEYEESLYKGWKTENNKSNGYYFKLLRSLMNNNNNKFHIRETQMIGIDHTTFNFFPLIYKRKTITNGDTLYLMGNREVEIKLLSYEYDKSGISSSLLYPVMNFVIVSNRPDNYLIAKDLEQVWVKLEDLDEFNSYVK